MKDSDYKLYSEAYSGNKPWITRYCRVEREGGVEWSTEGKWWPVLQLIHVHVDNEERIRFGYYKGDNKAFVARPLEIPEDLIPAMFEGALQAGVLSKGTVTKLRKVFENHEKDARR
jgi:hypothetical protein